MQNGVFLTLDLGEQSVSDVQRLISKLRGPTNDITTSDDDKTILATLSKFLEGKRYGGPGSMLKMKMGRGVV
jgi:hypothetical protein